MKKLLLYIFIALCLSACSVFTKPIYKPYWLPGVYTPVAGKPDIRVLDNVRTMCGETSGTGCWIPGTNIVYMQSGISAEEYRCWYNHEVEMHMHRGYGHGANAMPRDVCGSFH